MRRPIPTVVDRQATRHACTGGGADATPLSAVDNAPTPCGSGGMPMLIQFFYTLRAAKLPVSVKEYLTLLDAMKAGRPGRRRRPDHRQVLRAGPHRAGQGRGAVRQVRPRVRGLLQGGRADRRALQGAPAGLAHQAAGT
ncbi:hypothetical protein Ddc_24621 [Ditylenchus destructor]|nr:hypothetical protein Ddc_24621 [Ditylenchus destructor]